jgi:peptidoglycan/xylan/chitin deacetylase (PgdA/CDA1 family)
VFLKVRCTTLLQKLGLDQLVHTLWPNRLTTLCYHGVLPKRLQLADHGFYTTVSVSDFRAQLEWIANRFQVVSCAQVQEHYQGGTPLPPKALLITFDDGYWNNLNWAAPILAEYGFPAIFFLSTSYIGSTDLFWFDDLPRRVMKWPGRTIPVPGTGDPLPLPADPLERRKVCWRISALCKRVPDSVRVTYQEFLRQKTAGYELPFDEDMHRILTWNEVRSLAEQGFEIGSHTSTHPILTQLDDQGVNHELSDSRVRIEAELNRPCYALAYPNGTASDYDRRVGRLAQAAGFQVAFTTVNRPYGPLEDCFTISRMIVPGHVPLSSFTFAASGAQAVARRLLHA